MLTRYFMALGVRDIERCNSMSGLLQRHSQLEGVMYDEGLPADERIYRVKYRSLHEREEPSWPLTASCLTSAPAYGRVSNHMFIPVIANVKETNLVRD